MIKNVLPPFLWFTVYTVLEPFYTIILHQQ